MSFCCANFLLLKQFLFLIINLNGFSFKYFKILKSKQTNKYGIGGLKHINSGLVLMQQAVYEFFLRAKVAIFLTTKQNKLKGDLFYGFLLLFSALLACILRRFASIKMRHSFDGAIGLAIAWIVSGRMLFCSLLLVLAHLLMFRCIGKSRFVMLI